MKKATDVNELAEDFLKVLQFKIITTIKNHYGSLDEFKAEYGRACHGDNRALARFIKNFHIEHKIILSLTRTSFDGKTHLKEILAKLDSRKLVHKGKCDIKYKSGKKFSKLSTWFIPFKELDRLFALSGTLKTPFDTDSGYYTDRQHKLIDKLIFKYAKERKPYMKSEKFMQSVEARKTKAIAQRVATKEEISDNEAEALLASLGL